ncbi:hypothetical protein SAMN04489724_3068 [Algoriphagus locisalis]|uniref:RadC-like JAB domain-containing protein n=1 Tax=Algoriphagus locisalis TaxID=305507 RepID=A0A1I7CCP7_9BACT|nr:hypothetical protein [Algoriphagus locisalis]SFT97190.1 hypothetical protein SAMN04489724_3068 [Algoriphagus locisalis]
METAERKIDLFEVAEIKLSYSAKVKSSQRPRVASSRQVYEVFAKARDLPLLDHVILTVVGNFRFAGKSELYSPLF